MPKQSTHIFTEEELAKIRAWRIEGMSTRMMAYKLKLSPYAVSAKVARMGLALSAKATLQQLNGQKTANLRRGKKCTDTIPKLPERLEAEPSAHHPGAFITLQRARERQAAAPKLLRVDCCQWPADPVCHEPAQNNKPYCSMHCEVAYKKFKK